MATTYLTLLFVVHLVTLVFGIQQEITFYTELGYGGVGLTFRSNIPDLSDYSFITNNTKSYCAIGAWSGFRLKDFEEYVWAFGNINEETVCNNYNGPLFASIRHLGPPDTSTEAIGLYEGADASGREHLVTSPTSNNFPFNPIRYASSGKTVWTLFEGSDFDGNSKCTPPGAFNLNYGDMSPLQTVGSVVNGCGAEAQRNVANYKLGLAMNL